MELEVLGERYEMQEPIGRGGMATIYRAADLRMGRTVAVKILREMYSTDPKFVTRFQREARAASALQHPNIVQVYDYGQSGESYYIVMEFVDGADLRRYLKKRGILSNERAVEIAHDVALGLGAAHQRGIVHRDVKPQNVMLDDAGLVKLTDFGIASMYKDADAERLTTTGMTLGTVQYYAPEQAQGEIVTPAADIYALGIVMYEMLAGRTPFDGDTPVAVAMRHIQDLPEPPSHFNPRITPQLERIILRCLEKDPRDRYRDGDALAFALENYANGAGRRAGPSKPNLTNTPVGSRPAFAPLGLPSSDGRGAPGPAMQSGFGGSGGGQLLSGGPRPGRVAAPSGPVNPAAQGRPGAAGFVGGPTSGPRGMYGGYEAEQPYAQPFDEMGGYENRLNGATSPFGPAPGTEPRTGATGRPTGFGVASRPGSGTNPRRANGPLLAIGISAVALLLVLACVLVATIGSSAFGSFGLFAKPTAIPTIAMANVPMLVGTQLTSAEAAAQAAHMQIDPNTDVTYQADNDTTHPQGYILSQDPASGVSKPWGTHIKLVVSSGPQQVKVPDVINKTVSDATNTLTAAGFKVNLTPQVTTQYAPGIVINVNPPVNSAQPYGAIITITYSVAPATPTPSPSPSPTPSPTTPVGTPSPTPHP